MNLFGKCLLVGGTGVKAFLLTLSGNLIGAVLLLVYTAGMGLMDNQNKDLEC